ncbi:hypothetical protein L596_022650 [Steinernema carpocapsae]|nr:hypothetical protein L596_022650 [Steinernema carpocapsae]
MFMIGLNLNAKNPTYSEAGLYAAAKGVRTYVIMHSDHSKKALKLTDDVYKAFGAQLATDPDRVYFAINSKPDTTPDENNMKTIFRDSCTV